MKKIITIVLLFTCNIVFSQQLPEYTFFQLNKSIVNPAFTGLKECLDYRIGARVKYLSLGSELSTGYFSISGRLKSKRKKSLSTNFHGLGFTLEDDKIGVAKNTYINLNYAYNFKINKKNRISTGISIGTIFNRYNINNLNLTHANDPLLQNSGQQWIFPNIGFGLNLYGDNYFIGLSAKQLTKNKYAIGINSETKTHLNIIGGFIAYDMNNWKISPSINLMYTSKSPIYANLICMAEYNHSFGFGLSYKPQESVSILAKINIKKRFTVAYAFDIVTSSINYNSQEITLGFYTCNLFKSNDFNICPSFE
jgi:type IX secretion system PorP/SprF family membrane protein